MNAADKPRDPKTGIWPIEAKRLHTTHGEAGRIQTLEYKAWKELKKRCLDPNRTVAKYYIARGITVCERWRNSYAAFLEDMGRKPSPKHSLDRIDTNGHYEPGNCRWATHEEQVNNTRSNRLLTFNDKTMPITSWAKELGFRKETLFRRINSGWPVEIALTVKRHAIHRGNRLLTFNGKTMSIAAWGREVGFDRRTILSRLRRGWPTERALTEKLANAGLR